MGDVNEETGEIDDQIVTNNGDREKVLATVVYALYIFTSYFPDAWVYATGSTAARTRLYQMGISRYYHFASADFTIMGKSQNSWVPYEKGNNYQIIAVQRKTGKFGL